MLTGQKHIDAIAADLERVRPQGAVAVRLTYRTAGDYSAIHVEAIDAEGGVSQVRTGLYTATDDHVDDLRDETYIPGRGAWFTATITVTTDGQVTAEYDYNNDPDIQNPPPSLRTWVNDLRQFP